MRDTTRNYRLRHEKQKKSVFRGRERFRPTGNSEQTEHSGNVRIWHFIRDRRAVRHLIAFGVFGAFYMVAAAFLFEIVNGKTTAKEMWLVFGPIVGLVVGYFFRKEQGQQMKFK